MKNNQRVHQRNIKIDYIGIGIFFEIECENFENKIKMEELKNLKKNSRTPKSTFNTSELSII